MEGFLYSFLSLHYSYGLPSFLGFLVKLFFSSMFSSLSKILVSHAWFLATMQRIKEREISNEILNKKNPKLGVHADNKVTYLDLFFPLKASSHLQVD